MTNQKTFIDTHIVQQTKESVTNNIIRYVFSLEYKKFHVTSHY